jgi:DNA-binding transcriptional LysR family regulator
MARELAQTMRDALSAMEAMRLIDAAGRGPYRSRRFEPSRPASLPLLECTAAIEALRSRRRGRLRWLDAAPQNRRIGCGRRCQADGWGASRFRWTPLAHERFVLIAPPKSTGDSLTELLRTHDWIQFDPTLVSGRMAAQFLHRAAPRKRGSVEVDSIDTVHALVSAGRGVSGVPNRKHVISEVLPVREIALDNGSHYREIAFVSRQLDADNRRVLALQDAFQSAYLQSDS